MEYEINEGVGKNYKTIHLTATDFDEGSEMAKIEVGVYSNGRGFISCATKKSHGIVLPIPFKEGGRWQYVEGLEETE